MLEVENAGMRCIFEEPGRTRSSALLEPSGSGSHVSRLSGAGSLERPCGDERRSRGGVQRSRGSSSSHFERPSRAKMARCRKRWQVLCFRGQTEPADRVD